MKDAIVKLKNIPKYNFFSFILNYKPLSFVIINLIYCISNILLFNIYCLSYNLIACIIWFYYSHTSEN